MAEFVIFTLIVNSLDTVIDRLVLLQIALVIVQDRRCCGEMNLSGRVRLFVHLGNKHFQRFKFH